MLRFLATPFGSDQSNGSVVWATGRRSLAAILLLLWMVPLQACRPEGSAPRRSDAEMRKMALPEVRLLREPPPPHRTNPPANLKAGSRSSKP